MSLRALPPADPGVPDVRSGPRLLLWLERRQWRGQLAAGLWGLLHLASLAALPVAVGRAVQAVADGSAGALAAAAGRLVVTGAVAAVADTMLQRAAVTNWITAATRLQQLLSRKAAELGTVLGRRVAAGEVATVSTNDVEKIGWFVETTARFSSALAAVTGVAVTMAVAQPEMAWIVAVGCPLMTLSSLPLLPYATRRADVQRARAGRATVLVSDTVAGLRVLRGIGGEELFLRRYRRASQEVRGAAVHSARMWALIAAVQVVLPGLFLTAVVWRGARLALEGSMPVGELITCYGFAAFLVTPLRSFEEMAMAWSFSRPSARRAARLLAMRRQPVPAAPRCDVLPDGDLFDPVTGTL
ncbi:ABC transporter ATP-binding protein, partial [Streptomyces sp. UH6]|uniref:ABC transporter transmembrane domain-containing protein n=1 Tax=Streptomyces sp. UH6 TaxID=2748379 RepID=UPI0015D4BE69